MMIRAPHLFNIFFRRSEPFSLVHFVTDRCNARCPHCFMDFQSGAPETDLLSLEEIEALTRTMGNSLYNVNITGGEPFLRADLFDVVAAYMENTPVRSVVITSNGTRTDAMREFLARCRGRRFKGRIKISISIDRLGEKHDALRQVKGAFERALEAYRMVCAHADPSVLGEVAITVTPHNCAEVLGLHAELKKLGVAHFTSVLMREEGVVKRIENKAAVIEAYRALTTAILSDGTAGNEPASTHRIPEALRAVKNEIVRDRVCGDVTDSGARVPCTAGRLFGVIRERGDVFSCEPLGGEGHLGNVRSHGLDFLRLWKAERAREFHRRLARFPCSCTYECAWSVNVFSNARFMPRLIVRAARSAL